MQFLFLFVCIACTANPVFPQRNQDEANRIIQENSNGWCTTLSYCPQVLNFLQTQRIREAGRYVHILQNTCGNKSIGAEQLICCAQPTFQVTAILQGKRTNYQQGATASTCGQVKIPKPTDESEAPRRLPTLEEGCGRTITQSPRYTAIKTVNAKKGAWPWVALIFQDMENATTFRCIGTLVTVRHIITSSGCYEPWNDQFARLGTNDKNPNAVGEHVDIPLAGEAVPHESPFIILFMEQNADFSNAIVPICLQSSSESRNKSYANHFAIALGFGTDTPDCETNILQEQQLSFLDCKEQNSFNESFSSSLYCPREPACSKGLGSPLIIAEPFTADESRYFLIGVSTIATETKENNFYRNTQFIIDWIEEIISFKVRVTTLVTRD